ncbi:hypothetical protein H8E06_01255 [bacterium]|nr:hypothetical protein [bacterium]
MKVLEKEFKSCGFNFKQVKRTGDVAIYKKKAANHGGQSYEVIKVSRHNGYNLGDNYVHPAETYPSNSLWGTHGWTCQTIEAADLRFDKLLSNKPSQATVKLAVKKKPENTKQPYLTCIVTETQRPTTLKYLEGKACKLGVSVNALRANYISKPALSLLSKGMSVEEARHALNIVCANKVNKRQLDEAMMLNGRKRISVH